MEHTPLPMKDYVNEHLEATLELVELPGLTPYQKVRPRIVCADGISLSVQAGKYLYSTPRLDEMNHYVCVEVGYPDIEPPNTWREYAEEWTLKPFPRIKELVETIYRAVKSGLFGWDKKHGHGISKFIISHAWLQFIRGKARTTVYGYIPIKLVNQFIEEHGGTMIVTFTIRRNHEKAREPSNR